MDRKRFMMLCGEGGAFAQLCRGIALLRGAGFPVCGKLTIGAHNMGCLMAAAETIFEELALPFCSTNYVSEVTGYETCLCPNIVNFGIIMREYETLLQRYPNRFCNDGPYPVWHHWQSAPHPESVFQCRAALQRLQIAANGDVVRCLMLPEPAWGNACFTSLGEIWSQMPDTPIESAPECRKCDLHGRCFGRCGGKGSLCLAEYLRAGGKL